MSLTVLEQKHAFSNDVHAAFMKCLWQRARPPFLVDQGFQQNDAVYLHETHKM